MVKPRDWEELHERILIRREARQAWKVFGRSMLILAGIALIGGVIYLAEEGAHEKAQEPPSSGYDEPQQEPDPLAPLGGFCCGATIVVLLLLLAIAIWPTGGPSIHITRWR